MIVEFHLQNWPTYPQSFIYMPTYNYDHACLVRETFSPSQFHRSVWSVVTLKFMFIGLHNFSCQFTKLVILVIPAAEPSSYTCSEEKSIVLRISSGWPMGRNVPRSGSFRINIHILLYQKHTLTFLSFFHLAARDDGTHQIEVRNATKLFQTWW